MSVSVDDARGQLRASREVQAEPVSRPEGHDIDAASEGASRIAQGASPWSQVEQDADVGCEVAKALKLTKSWP
jgi:hypothetical protein